MRLLGLSFLVCFGFFGQAARADDPVRVLSFGTKTRGAFVKSDAQTKQLDLAWAIGFVSGVNSRSVGAERQVGEHWDPAALIGMARELLREKPPRPVVHGHRGPAECFGEKRGHTDDQIKRCLGPNWVHVHIAFETALS